MRPQSATAPGTPTPQTMYPLVFVRAARCRTCSGNLPGLGFSTLAFDKRPKAPLPQRIRTTRT